jgi:hypothetical protein
MKTFSMKTGALIFLSLAFPLLAFANDTTCTSAEGDLQFYSSQYSGGPGPVPGMVISVTKWTYQSKVLSQMSVRSPCFPDQHYPGETCPNPIVDDVLDADLVTKFVVGTEITLSESNPHNYFDNQRTYAVKSDLCRISGRPILPNSPILYSEFLICKEHRIMAP